MGEVHLGDSMRIVDLSTYYICVSICVWKNHRIDTGWDKTGDERKVTCKRCLKIMRRK